MPFIFKRGVACGEGPQPLSSNLPPPAKKTLVCSREYRWRGIKGVVETILGGKAIE